MSQADLEELCVTNGLERYRGRQIAAWLYRQARVRTDEGRGVAPALGDLHVLPKSARERLGSEVLLGVVPPSRVNESDDGTRKYLFPTIHGGFVEAAMIPDGDRVTLCLSTQVGCRRSCTFCQTARQGFQGNLTPAEVLTQYHALPERDRVTNIVYMGMGEPLDNLDATIASIERFVDPDAYALPQRRITLSTVGIHPELATFLDNERLERVSLAVSLHSAIPEERRRIMPVENANPITETVAMIRSRREDLRRRISFEYTLFAGVNDRPEDINAIARLLNGLSVRINLIPYHELDDSPLRRLGYDGMELFAEALRDKGFRATIRRSRGQDINAACGMLWTRHVRERAAATAGGQAASQGALAGAGGFVPVSGDR